MQPHILRLKSERNICRKKQNERVKALETVHTYKKFIRAIKIRLSELKSDVKENGIQIDKNTLLSPFNAMLHPIKFYGDMKEKGSGSVLMAIILWLLYFLVSIIEYFQKGFIFNFKQAKDFNIFYEFALSSAVLLVLSIVNWAFCTLLDGKGTFKEIWIVVCYGILPRVLFGIPLTLLSNVLRQEEATILLLLQFAVNAWCVILIFIGLLIIHEYSFSKTLFSCLLTFLGIAVLIYLLMMFVSMIQQLIAFVKTVFQEILSRR